MQRKCFITKEELAASTPFATFCGARLLADKKTVVKTGETARMSEANTMRFVRERTSIPLPEVYDAYVDDESGQVRIVMEFVEGTPLDKAWPDFSPEQKESVVAQLKGYFAELRQIEGHFIGCVDGSACNDQYFDNESAEGQYGPYEDEKAFNRGLAEAWTKSRGEGPWIRLMCRILEETVRGHRIVMTHNDFDPRNIIVRGDKVVALLDWELSGFYPEYWEYCKALWRPSWDSDWMKDEAVGRILDPYLSELSVVWNTSWSVW